MNILEKTYSPKDIESKIYENWENKGYFIAENNENKEPFCIILPPPNVTGVLHMGHILDASISDSLIRWKRMQGFDTLWLPGMDHAGIATQNVVERMLAKSNLKKEDLGREAFIDKIWEWKEQYGGTISKQFRKIGASLDWSRERFTMDSHSSLAVREMFKKLYDDDLIYRGEYIVNWCPRCTTALADDEIEHIDENGSIWHIKYPIEGSNEEFIVATTRPETMLGDSGVAVNPNDSRYKHLIGKFAILPLVNKKIPIVADEYVDMEFGTGVVKMTPAHDPNDFEVGKRQNLEIINIFTETAFINEKGGKYKGLDRFEARKQIVEDLQEQKYLVDIKPHSHAVGTCYRCKTIIEPRVSMQWFVRMKQLANRALEVVRENKIEIEPKRWEKVYYNWLENIRDWCISRQIWWGHQIPAYYTPNGDMIVAISLEEAQKEAKLKYNYNGELTEETNVLDTWFSSGLWPFSTLGWPDSDKDLSKFFPTSILITGADIIFFWVARMIMLSLYGLNEIPFKKVYLHGIVRDEIGRKMSKSLNNSPDALKLIDEYGADAIRFSLLYNTSKGQDVMFSEKIMEMGSNFANKVWNASKFVISNLEGFDYNTKLEEINLKLEDKYILSKLNNASKDISKYMNTNETDLAVKTAYEFFKNEFCDWYVEIAKTRVYNNDDSNDKKTAQWVLRFILDNGLRLLHPYMPFVTEEIWQIIRLKEDEKSIMISQFPEYTEDFNFIKEEKELQKLKEVIISIRNIRAEANIANSKPVEIIFNTKDENSAEILVSNKKILNRLVNVSNIYDIKDKEPSKLSGYRLAQDIEIFVPLDDLLDKEKEIEKINKEIEKTNKEYQRVDGKLNNDKFLSKAPKEIIEKEERIREELKYKLDKLQEKLELFKG